MSEIPKQNTVVSRKSNLVVAIIIGVIFLVWAGVGVTLLYQKYFNGFFVTQRDTSQEDGNQISTPEEATISNVFERVSPSVVSIVTSLSSGSSDGFWSSVGSQEAAGTGIIVGKDGYILTNKHVVDGAKSIKVISSTGEVYEDVDMIGVDPLNDIAFLKIKNVSKSEK
jgi:S1-C subfamily serine protease